LPLILPAVVTLYTCPLSAPGVKAPYEPALPPAIVPLYTKASFAAMPLLIADHTALDVGTFVSLELADGVVVVIPIAEDLTYVLLAPTIMVFDGKVLS